MNSNRASLIFSDNTLSIIGEVDFATVAALSNEGTQWFKSQAPSHTKIDCNGITLCNSSATTLLLHLLRAAHNAKKTATIENIPPVLLGLIKLGGIEDILNIPHHV